MDGYLVQVVIREAKDGVYFTRLGSVIVLVVIPATAKHFRTGYDGR